VIADSKRDLKERRESTLEQAALRRIATLVAQGVQPHELFAVVAEEVGRVVDAPSVGVARFESDATATVCGTFPPQGPVFRTGTRVSLEGANVLGLVRERAEPARIYDYTELEGEIADAVRRSGMRSSVGVPIVVAGGVWGAIVASSTERLPENTEARLAAFTELLAAAIANAEAREALARLADEQAALQRVATLVAQGAAPAEVFAAVSAEIDRVFHLDPATFDVAGVVRFEPGPEIVVVGVSKSVEAVPLGSRFPPDELFAPTHVLRTERSARIRADDVGAAATEVADFLRHHGYLSQAASPIVVDGRLWGAISVNSRSDLPPDTEERLARFTELVATAIANADSHTDAERLATQQAALRRVATLVAEGAAPADVFTAVTWEVAQLFDFAAVTLSRYEDDAVVVLADPQDSGFAVGSRWPFDGDSLSVRVRATGRMARIDDYSDIEGSAAARMRARDSRSAVGVPIVVEGSLWGILCVGAAASELLPADIEARIAGFVELVGTAIANSQARDGLRLLADEQAALRRVATLVASGTAPDELFAAVADEVQQLLGADASAIIRFEDDGTVVTVGSHAGLYAAGTRSELDPRFVVGSVRRTGRAARFDTDDPSAPDMPEIVWETGVCSAVASPIVVEGELWGAIVVGSLSRSLPSETEGRLADFTDLVATAVANTQAREEVTALADEQAALRRVATLVAQGVQPDAIFSAVGEEIGRLFGSSITTVGRFEPDAPVLVAVGVGTGGEGIPVGSRWELDDRLAAAQVFQTGRTARVDEVDWSAVRGPLAPIGSRLGVASTVASPIFVEGRLWGVVSVSDNKQLPPETEERLEKFSELIATAIGNAESSAELAASRRRIVAAADDARRRIERDLHDGIQQRLIALTFRARAMTRRPPDELPGIAAELSEGLKDASDELREISRGIHPTILTEAGLGPALRALARRSEIPIDVDVKLDERLPTPVEAAAYYIVSEALTNVAKHAHANIVELTAAHCDGTLTLEVRDDGVGGVDAARGSGILGLTDRVEALGGTISIASPPRGGTTLSVHLPVTT
jgi:signal transduction histidine kinase/uncharacterized protein YoaH (UPF0181 family)